MLITSRYRSDMDVQANLDVALIRRQAEHAARVAELRLARHREETQRPAVKYGAAASHHDKTSDVQKTDPVAISEPPQPKDPNHLIDVTV